MSCGGGGGGGGGGSVQLVDVMAVMKKEGGWGRGGWMVNVCGGVW